MFAISMTMYYTGIREGELLALIPADIDFEKVCFGKLPPAFGGGAVLLDFFILAF